MAPCPSFVPTAAGSLPRVTHCARTHVDISLQNWGCGETGVPSSPCHLSFSRGRRYNRQRNEGVLSQDKRPPQQPKRFSRGKWQGVGLLSLGAGGVSWRADGAEQGREGGRHYFIHGKLVWSHPLQQQERGKDEKGQSPIKNRPCRVVPFNANKGTSFPPKKNSHSAELNRLAST